MKPVMRITTTLALLVCIIGASCSKPSAVVAEAIPQDTYLVKVENDRIVFKGIDRPSIVDARPDDKFAVSGKIGRYNSSLNARCVRVSEKAMEELGPLVRRADSATLINSLRGTYEGEIDCGIAADGNMMILNELRKRRPLPDNLPKAERIFLGVSGPAVDDIGVLMQMKDETDRYHQGSSDANP